MAKRTLKSEDVEGFIRAFHDELDDTAEMYKVRIEFTLRRGKLRGELNIHGEAYRKDEQGSEQLYAQSDYLFPTHRASALHAALYGAGIRLNVAVQAKFRDEEGHFYSEHPL